METFKSFASEIYTVNESSFRDIALKLFAFQVANNPVYHSFVTQLGVSVEKVRSLEDIPYLPISFFKTHEIQTGKWIPETIFFSSGTTNSNPSRHLVPDLQFYLNHSQKCFEHFLGPITDFHFLALLPSYLERKGSSLVAMIDYFITKSGSAHSGFYLNDHATLVHTLGQLKNDSRKAILWGVSFALLDLADRYNIDLSQCMVMETGGMKGRRREITRFEMQEIVKARFNVKTLFSEYGMTELLSQAYSISGNSRFSCPPWMRIICRDITDPLKKGLQSEMGGINVIDLANWQTLSFIETEDLGKVYTDGSFEVLGRLDNSDLRGCNLMIQ
ncbi:acyl transferase [Chryseolinea sp. H1M3-3]|uniref:acyl transferase n=1 Tax=Chryseolinea sp. H1M3-3 TaxID=3034144 RepID=UPI0023EE20ED|nr:acyl transferase [Chryseolinea sp. H1M3-3]